MSKLVNITIDDIPFSVPYGITILQACIDLEKEIPVFCYHQRLAIAGNCRMCLVEVHNIPKPVASCAMPVSEGMTIYTHSPMVEKARKSNLEFLLINHPLDCPICDQGGECDLQDITMNYGKGQSRFVLNKRAVPEKYMGPLIKTAMNRCIHCTRCIRFSTEIAGVEEIGTLHRSEHTEISTLENAITSELSGNLIDVCPVGALTSKPYAFHARSWELKKTAGIDITDAIGSHIRIDSKQDSVMRILPRECDAINEEWISDKTRFSYDGLSNQRIDKPFIRENDKLKPARWNDALNLVIQKIDQTNPSKIACIAGDLVDLEGMYALNKLLESLHINNKDCRQDGSNYLSSHLCHAAFNTTIEGIEQSDCILLIGTHPRYEAPLINARIRKRYLNGGVKIGLIGPYADLTYVYEYLDENPEVLHEITEGKHPFCKALENAKKPMVIVGQSATQRNDYEAIVTTLNQLFQRYPNFVQSELEKPWIGLNVLHTAAARMGGLALQFLPSKQGLATTEIIEQCQNGELECLISYAADELSYKTFSKNTFVIYVGHHGDVGAHRADVILPSSCFTEKSAYYINTEGRIQFSFQAVNPPGEAKHDWKIFREIAVRMNINLPFESIDTLRERMFHDLPHLNRGKGFIHMPWVDFPQFSQEAKITSSPFRYPISNFYMTCPITRHSKTMATCSVELNKSKNMKENGYD